MILFRVDGSLGENHQTKVITMIEFPVVSFPQLFHVGTLDRLDKKEQSYEGDGFSVSTCPDTWRAIARLSGDVWRVNKSNSVFLDAYAITGAQKDSVLQWGYDSGYIKPVRKYQVEWFDDEMDGQMYSLFTDEEDALNESEDMEGSVTEVSDYQATATFPDSTVNSEMSSIVLWDILLTIYVRELNPELDGVWWDEVEDVARYSAPRGVIGLHRLSDWKISKTAL